MTRSGPVAACIAFLLVCAACSKSPEDAARSAAAAQLDGSPPIAAPKGRPADDWTTFAHDQLRTGYQPQATGISKDTAGALRLRWKYLTTFALQASPLVSGGRVYVVTSNGTIFVLGASDGKLLWKRALPAGTIVAMTPALVDGMLFVGDHREGGLLRALDARNGKTLWQAPFAGGVRAEPVIANGIVVEGETGGDAPPCHRAGVYAFDERTGKRLWDWRVDKHDHKGGAVWSPLSYRDGHLLFGTGNTCETGVATSDAVVSLTMGGRLLWAYNPSNSITDSDVGGGTMLLHGQAIVTSKNGNLYDLDEKTGALNWKTKLANFPGYGGVGTPSTDGKTFVASAGFVNDPTKTNPPGGALLGLDSAGNILWKIHTQHPISGNAPIANGVVFTPLDQSFVALDLLTGARLWEYPMGQYAYPSPAIVPSGVYFANTAGEIYAFGLGSRHA